MTKDDEQVIKVSIFLQGQGTPSPVIPLAYGMKIFKPLTYSLNVEQILHRLGNESPYKLVYMLCVLQFHPILFF